MTHYGCVDRGLWERPAVRRLSNDERLLLVYLLTSERGNMIGVYVCPPMFAAYYTGLSADAVTTALKGPLTPFVTFDPATEEVFIHESARLQVAKHLKQADNRRPKVERLVEGILSDRLRDAFLVEYADWGLGSPLGAPSEGGSEAPSEEDRTETETETEAEGPPEAPAARSVFEYWRAAREEALELNGGPRALPTEKRLSKVRARLKEGYTEDQLRQAIDGCMRDPYNVENGYLDLELICRDQAHVDQYRQKSLKQVANSAPREQAPTIDELEYLREVEP